MARATVSKLLEQYARNADETARLADEREGLRRALMDGMKREKVNAATGGGFAATLAAGESFDWSPAAVRAMLTDRELDEFMPRKVDGTAMRKAYESDTVFEGRVKASKAAKISRDTVLRVARIKKTA